MTNVKISELTPASSATLGMQLETDTSGTTSEKITLTQALKLTTFTDIKHIDFFPLTYWEIPAVPSAEVFMGGSIYRTISWGDLTNFTQVRLTVVIVDYGYSPAHIDMKYCTTYSTTIGDYADIGTSSVHVHLSTPGIIQSSWISLASGAKTNVNMILSTKDGNDSTHVIVARAYGEFR